MDELVVFQHPGDHDLNKGRKTWYTHGWYYWMTNQLNRPTTEPLGPFETFDEAYEDATEGEL